MKLACDIVQDLLPLYEEGLCSEASRSAIEEHLNECPSCSKLVDGMRKFNEPVLSETTISREDKVIVKSFRKVHRRWIASLLAILLSILLIIPIVILSINQSKLEGICFTNLDEIWITRKYMRALEQGDYKKAASYIDYEHLYNEINDLLCMKPEDFKKPFQHITLNEKEWMVTEGYYQLFTQNEWDEQLIWSFLIYNMMPDVLIPVDVWNEMMTLQPDVFYAVDNGTYIKDGATYIPMECEWGTFMVEATSAILQYESAAEFCSTLDFLPIEIYEEAKTEMEADALSSYQHIQEKYRAVADMTVKEFEQFMKDYYINQLQECLSLGYSVEITGLDESYYIKENGNWHIGYGIEISYRRNVYPITVTFSVDDKKIRTVVSATYKTQYPDEELERFIEALHLSYPELMN